jgi:site-specific DNA-methyltransferase (adenine-specific)
MNIDLIQGDSLTELKKIESNSVDLVVTSPPYNKNYWTRNRSQGTWKRIINYDSFNDMLEPEEYVKQQKEVLNELVRIIKPTGSIFYNHADIFHKNNTIHPSYVYDYNIKQIIVWDRGSTPYLTKEYFFKTTEWIFWIKKDFNASPYFDKSKATHKKNIWKISKEIKKQHPAPFSEELVENIVRSCCPENGVILDCYNGSGTTGVVALRNNMSYIGIDISEQYIQMTKDRLKCPQLI